MLQVIGIFISAAVCLLHESNIFYGFFVVADVICHTVYLSRLYACASLLSCFFVFILFYVSFCKLLTFLFLPIP